MKRAIETLPHGTVDERRILADNVVTMDGLPARISGFRNQFATVYFKHSGAGVEFAWRTVAHVIANRGGHFKS